MHISRRAAGQWTIRSIEIIGGVSGPITETRQFGHILKETAEARWGPAGV